MLGRSLTLVWLGILAGCATTPPEILKSDGYFVTVSQPRNVRESAARKVARAYCEQHGMHATRLSSACSEPTCAIREVTYWCR